MFLCRSENPQEPPSSPEIQVDLVGLSARARSSTNSLSRCCGAGGYFGAQLARAGEDVIFIARGQHLNAIRMHGLCIETPAGEIVVRPALVTDDPAQVSNVDVVLVGVKAWQVEEAAKNLRPIVGPKTLVVPLQNGVEAPSQLASVLGAEHVLVGLCGTLSWVTAPGRNSYSGIRKLHQIR
jgi:2-dehydropantoate 2-reductase